MRNPQIDHIYVVKNGVHVNVGDGFGDVVRSHRMAAGLTQEELALRSGLGMRTISDIERGRTTRPRRSSVDLLGRALGLGLGDQGMDDQPGELPPAAGAPSPGRTWHQSDLAPLPALIPRQLPPTTKHFVGRADELKALDRLLTRDCGKPGSAAIWVISGIAGVGKTALALHWAHQASGHFPDGQIYADLRGFGPSGSPLAAGKAIGDMLSSLEVPAKRIPASLQARTGLYRSLLSGKRMLIILDNAKDASQVRPLLPGTPSCAVIVTSRSQLTGLVAIEDASPVTLGTLSTAEARELLAKRLGYERVRGESRTIRELIDLCGRLPLALAIVAARASVGPPHLLSALAGELRDVRRRLDALDAGETATSARATFSWSYRTLPDPAAQMFHILSVHPTTDITPPTAAAQTGVPLHQARQALRALTHANLLTERTPDHFTLHPLLRTYAAEQPTPLPTAAAH